MRTRHTPIMIGEIELDEPNPGLETRRGPDGRPYERALLLVRLHRQAFGYAEVVLRDGHIGPEELDHQISATLGEEIVAHLVGDGLAVGALSDAALPPCLAPEQADATLPLASVVIPTRDRPEALAWCLEHVLRLDYPDFEIIVVDNAPSTSSTAELVTERYRSEGRVRYISEARPGLSRARNRGIEEARGSVVAFTDDDVRVDRWWLRSLVRGFSRAPGVGCVTGLVVPAELDTPAQLLFERAQPWARKAGFQPRLFDADGQCPQPPLFPYQSFVPGCGISAFDAAVIRSLGGFDPALGAGSPACGGEDLDMSVRLIRSRSRIAFEPSAIGWHVHRRESPALRHQLFHYGVGLTAYLTKQLSTWETGREIVARVPRGSALLAQRVFKRGPDAGAGLPLSLALIEAAGMCCGPGAYMRSRRWARIGA